MLVNYMVLGLSPDAEDNSIRRRYLELVRRYPPEKAPRRFQEISEAYEQIKNLRARIRASLMSPLSEGDSKQALHRLARASRPERRRAGLGELMADMDRHF